MLKPPLSFSILLALFETVSFAQEIKPKGYFSKDTIKVGEVVNYHLIIDYPRGMEVLFPDSTHDYYPFEYAGRQFESTSSDINTSYDSAVYQLITFELDSTQSLKLPVYLITNGDSSAIYTELDSLQLQFLITEVADSLTVKETAAYQPVNRAFNYPYLFIALGVVFIIALVILVVFGQRIRTWLKLYRMKRSHERYVARFDRLQSDGLDTVTKAESLLALWKKYLERLEGLPYTKLTTKEIVTIEDNQDYRDTLRSMDSNIYGRFHSNVVDQLSTQLKEYSINRYLQKREEVKHA